MTRFLKLIIEPIFLEDGENPGVFVDETRRQNFTDQGSKGSGEYLFNLDAIISDSTTINQDRTDSELCTNVDFMIGDQQAYQGIRLIWGRVIPGEGGSELLEQSNSLFGPNNLESAIESFDEGSTYGDLTNLNEALDALCAGNRIFSEALKPKQGNTKLAAVLSSRDFKGKVYDNEGKLCELIGWKFEICDA
tara:strand:+ start:55 stop:630 length:576 start_codon:yes stop_codon:yes gene_type:complete